MKLLLCSEGFYTEEIVVKCEELVGKRREEISVAVINEAYAVEHEDNLRWVLINLNLVKDNFGGKSELVNLLALDVDTVKERLERHDVVFVVGGNTDYLMRVLEKTGFSNLLPEILKTKVYVGSSAGSMVIGRRLDKEAFEKVDGKKDNYGVSKYLELVDFAFVPHLNNSYFPNRREILKEAARQHKGVIYGLRDDSAVVVEDDKITTIGSEPLILNN